MTGFAVYLTYNAVHDAPRLAQQRIKIFAQSLPERWMK